MIQILQTRRAPRLLAWTLAALMVSPTALAMAGCGNSGSGSGGGGQAQTSTTTSTAPNATNAPGAAPTSSMASGTAASGSPAAGAAASNTAGTNTPAHTGLTTKQKVVILAGAALLYYLYRKHQAAQQAQQAQGATQTASGATPQLYRSSNGGVYYRDPQNPRKVVWLTVPNQPVQVPANEVQQYAPDYRQYQGQPAPAAPAGQATQPFTQYDPNAVSQ